MRTVSTKLDNVDHDRLLEICNEEGKTVSEWLRDLIQDCCHTLKEEKETESKLDKGLESTKLDEKPRYKVIFDDNIPKGQVTKVSYDKGKTWIDVKN